MLPSTPPMLLRHVVQASKRLVRPCTIELYGPRPISRSPCHWHLRSVVSRSWQAWQAACSGKEDKRAEFWSADTQCSCLHMSGGHPKPFQPQVSLSSFSAQVVLISARPARKFTGKSASARQKRVCQQTTDAQSALVVNVSKANRLNMNTLG